MADNDFRRRASMDSISLPDESKINQLNKRKPGVGVNAMADQIFDGHRFNKPGNFDAVGRFHEKLEEKKPRENPEDAFIPKPDPTKKAPDHLHKGVKVGTAYVERKRVFIWIGFFIALIIAALLFLPPVMSSKAEDTRVLYDRNVFASKGMTEFKSYALANYSVYNENAFLSEKNENYRVIELSVHMQNSSPFETKIPQYKVFKCPEKYRSRICYVTSANTAEDADGTTRVIGDTVPGFAGADIKIEIMVNVTDMTDEELDKCITGLVLCTDDAQKKIAPKKYIHCLPGLLFISNNVSVSLDP
ncbi:MAG: hypothetical protein IJ806_08450 [Ruminococcus sp.]|nr:hypothetical protein [Ruminococcus sp.]